MYQGNSIVDWLKSQGQKSDYASRATLAASKGITGYSGSAEQNTQLLNILRGGATPTLPTTGTSPGQASPQTTPTAQPAQQTPGGGTTPEGIPISQLPPDLVWNGQLDVSNPDKQTKYNLLVSNFKGGGTPASSGASVGTGFLNTPSINLPEIYQGLYDSSGVSNLEKQLSDQTTAFNNAQSKINDNPFLSEATRVGRIAKLNTDFNANTANIRNDIVTKKADIETKLNIQTKQFDINSQQATQALAQFQTLLSSGALSNASGEDIAAITRATGMSSTMINAAIKATKDKNVQTSTIQFDDGTNQGFAIINSNTGEIIKKDIVAKSKPKAATVGETKETEAQQTQKNAVADIQAGSTLRDIINHYAVSGGLTVEELYRLYNTNSPYGKAGETLDQVKQGKFKA